jgi:hypothetical protein
MTKELKLRERSKIAIQEKFGNVMFAVANCNWVTNQIISKVKSTRKMYHKAIKLVFLKIMLFNLKSFLKFFLLYII